jgi:hypothetical protein
VNFFLFNCDLISLRKTVLWKTIQLLNSRCNLIILTLRLLTEASARDGPPPQVPLLTDRTESQVTAADAAGTDINGRDSLARRRLTLIKPDIVISTAPPPQPVAFDSSLSPDESPGK